MGHDLSCDLQKCRNMDLRFSIATELSRHPLPESTLPTKYAWPGNEPKRPFTRRFSHARPSARSGFDSLTRLMASFVWGLKAIFTPCCSARSINSGNWHLPHFLHSSTSSDRSILRDRYVDNRWAQVGIGYEYLCVCRCSDHPG